MYSEAAWVLVSSGTQVQPQIIVEPAVSYDYVLLHMYLPFISRFLNTLFSVRFCFYRAYHTKKECRCLAVVKMFVRKRIKTFSAAAKV